MSSFSKSKAFLTCIAALATATVTSVGPVHAVQSDPMVTLYDGSFQRVPAVRETGRSVAAHCQLEDHMSDDHWADAEAHLILNQGISSSEVIISVQNARPDTLYTVWLMLAGGSPLMKAGATALIHSDDLADAVSLMGDPDTQATNGFTTDADGNGSLSMSLDYPIVGGAFPFQRYEGFDADSAAFTQETPRAIPVAIAGAGVGVPFTLRLASHCGDNLHNGLVAGQHEPWFDWLAE